MNLEQSGTAACPVTKKVTFLVFASRYPIRSNSEEEGLILLQFLCGRWTSGLGARLCSLLHIWDAGEEAEEDVKQHALSDLL